ncbi:MAG: hypothetical protein RR605_00560 [Acinetobacter sp.]
MIRSSIARAVSRPVTRPVNGAKLSFEIVMKKLFANGEQGFFYDPNDLTTMFQDAAGTVPVTGAGQAVGLIKDKSGRGNHARQTNSTSRPLLQRNATTGAYYLAFDGVDDFLQTNNIDFTSTNEMSLFVAVRIIYTSDKEAYQVVMELSGDAGVNNGSFVLTTPHGAVSSLQYGSRGTMRSNNIFSGITAEQRVITAKSKISSNLNNVRVSGGVYNNVSTAQGTGNYGNYPLYIGRRGGTSLSFSGHIYSLIGIGRLTTDAETIALEKSIAKNTGVTLNV